MCKHSLNGVLTKSSYSSLLHFFYDLLFEIQVPLFQVCETGSQSSDSHDHIMAELRHLAAEIVLFNRR